MEVSIRCKDGTYIDVHDATLVILDSGEKVEMIITCHDGILTVMQNGQIISTKECVSSSDNKTYCNCDECKEYTEYIQKMWGEEQ